MSEIIVAGLDIGSLTAKAVIFSKGKMVAYHIIPTGYDPIRSSREVMDRVLEKASFVLGDIQHIVATGYGRVLVPFSQATVTEISCHAVGNKWFFPKLRTILDMGGQDCKAIWLGENGEVDKFVMNDKCAAGTGRYLERIAKTLDVPLEEVGPRSLKPMSKPALISSFCTVFAQQDVLMLLREGIHRNDILAGACDAIVERVFLLLDQVGIKQEMAISGGIAKNIGVVKRMEQRVGGKIHVAPEPQIAGAIGAALIAKRMIANETR